MSANAARRNSLMRNPALAAIKLYQLAISPYLPGLCRHAPSCSNYSYEAISKHGFARGMWLTLKRLYRCNPLGSSGYDPVP